MKVDRMTTAYARQAVQEAMRAFLFDPNIHLIDFGYPEHNGEIVEDELAIRIHVRKKLFGIELQAAVDNGLTRPIPPSIGGFPTDVPQGVYRPHWWWNWSSWWRPPVTNPRAVRADPLRGGISISSERQNGYGTLGGLVVDRLSGEPMILSNWHVLVGDWSARAGQRIYQAGRLDGGVPLDTVAALTRDAMSDSLDAAVATLNGSRICINDQLDLGPVTGVRRAQLGMRVVKSGRRTNVTRGRVTAVDGIAKITYAGLDRVIRQVVTIEPYWANQEVSAPGDSGSWWLEEESRQAVGLHFAGSNEPERALSLDMLSVLNALNIDIVTDVGARTQMARASVPGTRPLVLARV